MNVSDLAEYASSRYRVTDVTDRFGRSLYQWDNPDKDGAGEYGEDSVVPCAIGDPVHLVSSKVGPDLHSPVLDIDFAARLIPSRTKGHFHLYLDGLTLDTKAYKKLLIALKDAGVIQLGILNRFERNEATFVRVPKDFSNG